MGRARFHGRDSEPSHALPSIPSVSAASPKAVSIPGSLGQDWEFWAVRLLLIGFSSILCYNLGPFGLHGLPAAGLGFLVAMVVLLAELRLRRAEISGLVGGVFGTVLGLLSSLLFTLVISRTAEPEPTRSFLEFTSLFALGYLGLVIGSSKGNDLRQFPLPLPVEMPLSDMQGMKLLDTSALIDGRIADICETHFLDGALGVPRFVLLELQHVADSPDSLKRQRGRRGLDVLERMRKMSWIDLRVLEEDVPGTTAVDQKLVELARRSASKIITNDFNLNKVARVQGISVLNVNELANAMKPVVLPGESMRVLILREGKESSQGVAYLDDGTMVVVDGARRFINRTIDILVTSTHQTPAGKMIFGRVEERADSSATRIAAAPAALAESAPGGNGHGQGHASPAGRFEAAAPAAYTRPEPQ
jgi:uncharacterized protein YacL